MATFRVCEPGDYCDEWDTVEADDPEAAARQLVGNREDCAQYDVLVWDGAARRVHHIRVSVEIKREVSIVCVPVK